MSTARTRTLLVGLSGPSSSGKTTLARFLRTIYTIPASASASSTDTNKISVTASILHIDDFYKTDKEIPTITLSPPLPSGRSDTRTEQNWDCAESIDLALLARALRHIRTSATGDLPDDLLAASKEDQNEVGPAPAGVSDQLLDRLREQVRASLRPGTAEDAVDRVRIWFVDAFLLYTSPSSPSSSAAAQLYDLSRLLDVKLWIPCSRRLMLERRLRRKGYVTLESFWEDPPGYVEDVVWPEFVREHAWLVSERDDGRGGGGDKVLVLDQDAATRENILVAPQQQDGAGSTVVAMPDLIGWAVNAVQGQLDIQ